MRALVIEDHTLYRLGLALLLAQRFEGLEVFEAATLEAGLEVLRDRSGMDLVLLGLGLPDGQGSEGVRRLRAAGHGGPLMVVAVDLDAREVAEVVRCGAAGYLPKTLGADAVEAAVRSVLQGRTYLPRSVEIEPSWISPSLSDARDPAQRARIVAELDLSDRQLQVLALLARGCSNKEIARRLDLLESTVKTHSLAVFRKLGVGKRADAVLAATRLGLTFDD